MALLMPDAGENLMLQMLLNKTAPEDLTLKLYKNDYTPEAASTEADFTEADFTGYADASLAGAGWTITPGAPTSAAYAQQTFTSTAGGQSQPIYGYYVVQALSGSILWAERFTGLDAPYTIANNGDAIKVTPNLTLA